MGELLRNGPYEGYVLLVIFYLMVMETALGCLFPSDSDFLTEFHNIDLIHKTQHHLTKN